MKTFISGILIEHCLAVFSNPSTMDPWRIQPSAPREPLTQLGFIHINKAKLPASALLCYSPCACESSLVTDPAQRANELFVSEGVDKPLYCISI